MTFKGSFKLSTLVVSRPILSGGLDTTSELRRSFLCMHGIVPHLAIAMLSHVPFPCRARWFLLRSMACSFARLLFQQSFIRSLETSFSLCPEFFRRLFVCNFNQHTQLLPTSALNSDAISGFCSRLASALRTGSFAFLFLRLKRTSATENWWSVPQSAPGNVRQFVTSDRCRLVVTM